MWREEGSLEWYRTVHVRVPLAARAGTRTWYCIVRCIDYRPIVGVESGEPGAPTCTAYRSTTSSTRRSGAHPSMHDTLGSGASQVTFDHILDGLALSGCQRPQGKSRKFRFPTLGGLRSLELVELDLHVQVILRMQYGGELPVSTCDQQ